MKLLMRVPEVPPTRAGSDVVPDGDDEDEDAARPDPGHRVRHVDLHEGGERIRPERASGPHVARRDRLHHAVEREHHEREQDVGHGDDRPGAVVDHREAVVVADETDPHEEVIDDPLLLEERDPARGPDQERGPEREQHHDHQQVARANGQGRHQVRDRVAEEEAEHGDDEAEPQGPAEEVHVDLPLLRLAGDGAVRGESKVGGGEVVRGGVGGALALDEPPDVEVPPALVELDHRLPVGGLVDALRAPPGLAKEARHAAELVVEPYPHPADGAVLPALLEIRHEGLEHRLFGQLAPGRVPVGKLRDRAVQHAPDELVLDAAKEHVPDGDEEGDEEECEEGEDEPERLETAPSQGPREAHLERGPVRGGERRGMVRSDGGHDDSRAKRRRAGGGPPPRLEAARYRLSRRATRQPLASQALNRSFISSP